MSPSFKEQFKRLSSGIDQIRDRLTALEQSGDSGGLLPDRVYDTSGRAHGELTGTDDASVVNDAIADRTDGTSIVIPDPGFVLGWDQQVDLPTEDRFALETVGTPTIRPPADFADSHILYEPRERGSDQYIGSLYISDLNGVLPDAAVHLEDIRGTVIDRVRVYNAPGFRITSEDIYANQNVLNRCEIIQPGSWRDTRNGGNGIVLDTGTRGNTTDQNWILAPHFNASRDHTGEIGYLDRGKHNNWLYTRFEFGEVVHQMEGDSNYFVSEGGWDRPDGYTVREVGGTSGNPPNGFIQNIYGDNYGRLRILNPNTRVTTSGDVDSGARPRLSIIDLLEDVKKMTSARTLESCGLQDESKGGSVEIGPTWFYKPFLQWDTEAVSGSTAVLSTGPDSLSTTPLPKVAYSWVPRGAGDTTDVIARTGLYGDSDNYFELVYDPNNTLGGHPTSSWYVELMKGGTERGCIDTGITPHDENDISFNICQLDSGDYFCASVDYDDFEIPAGLTGWNVPMKWRWSVETLADESKDWRLRDDRGMRFYKY